MKNHKLIKRNIKIPLEIFNNLQEYFLLNRTNMSSTIRKIIRKIIYTHDELNFKHATFTGNKKSVNFYVLKSDWDKLKNICKTNNIKMSDLITFYLEKILKE